MRLLDDQSCPALARGVRLNTDSKTGEPVMLFPEGVLYLSETANDVVARCNGHEPISSIVSSLAEEYAVDEKTLRQDVLDCLNDLYQRKLIAF
jgi:coenzyme PQQ biosynthesis protein PqqD